MSDVENDLRARVDSFVEQLSELIRRQAVAAVEELLSGGAGGDRAPGQRGHGARRGRPPASAATGEKPAAVAKSAKPGRARKAGEKRSPAELAAVIDQLFAYVKSNGGQGIEQIAKGLATSTKELTLPIRKLLKDKKIASKGHKRATRYNAR